MSLHAFELKGADGKMIRGDRAEGSGRQVLFITGFLSKRWGNKSKALAQWCAEAGWGFCCYDVRGFGDSEGKFTDYTLSDWIADARSVISMLTTSANLTHPAPARRDAPFPDLTCPTPALSHPPVPSLPSQAPVPRDAHFPGLTIVGNSLGGWIAWLMAQEHEHIDRLILIAPAFNMMGVRARTIAPERRHDWHSAGSMPWDDDPLHRDWPLSWQWVEESEAYWDSSVSHLRPVRTTILHGTADTVILPEGSRDFMNLVLHQDPAYPIELRLLPGDHRLSGAEHMESLRRLVLEGV